VVAAGVLIARCTHPAAEGLWVDASGCGPWLFSLAVVLAVAAPVVVRTLFAHRMRHNRVVAEADFFQFQRRMIHWALLTPYLAVAACLIPLPRFFFAGIILATLYAVYYTYPSRRRIGFDRRLFRVRKECDA
jgi:hypothetical protein